MTSHPCGKGKTGAGEREGESDALQRGPQRGHKEDTYREIQVYGAARKSLIDFVLTIVTTKVQVYSCRTVLKPAVLP